MAVVSFQMAVLLKITSLSYWKVLNLFLARITGLGMANMNSSRNETSLGLFSPLKSSIVQLNMLALNGLSLNPAAGPLRLLYITRTLCIDLSFDVDHEMSTYLALLKWLLSD